MRSVKKLMNNGWEFLKLSPGSSPEDARNTSEWKKVDLPHDWLISQHHDLYESADAWYRRELIMNSLPASCLIYFDGVYMDCDVMLNGEIVCSHAFGYTSFTADMSGRLRQGQNEILVHRNCLHPCEGMPTFASVKNHKKQ